MGDIKISEVHLPIPLGEGPHWDEDDETLLYVDILGGDLHRHFTKTERHQILHVGKYLKYCCCWIGGQQSIE